MDEQGAEAGSLLSQDPGCVGVDGKAQAGFFFRLINGSVGAGIDDDRGFDALDRVPNRLFAGQVAFLPTCQDHVAAGVVQAGEFGPDLSVFSGDQYAHLNRLSVEEVDGSYAQIVRRAVFNGLQNILARLPSSEVGLFSNLCGLP